MAYGMSDSGSLTDQFIATGDPSIYAGRQSYSSVNDEGWAQDLFGPEGLQDLLGASAGLAGGVGAFGIGALGAGAAAGSLGGGLSGGLGEAGGAMAFAPEGVGYGEAPAWFSSLGEGAMAGGTPTAEAGGSLSDFLALTDPGAAGAGSSAGGLEGTFGMAEEGLAAGGGSAGGVEGSLEGTMGGAEDALTPKAGSQSWWDKIVSGATTSLTKNPLGIAAAGIGLGANMLKGQQDPAEMAALRAQAGALGDQSKNLNTQGQLLTSYLQSGTLPPGLQASVTAAADAMKARIIQNHAKNGMSTDPTQNSALAQELGQADLNAVMMTAKLGQELMKSGQDFLKLGIDNATLSGKIYESLVRLDREQSRATGQAIASFAAALGGGTTLKLAA